MSRPDFSLVGKTAIVTGARRGIGKEIALTFAEAGADVACCDVVVEDGELEAVAEEIRGFGQRSLAVQVDITRNADVDNMVQRVVDEFGRIDILVNNAAIGGRTYLRGRVLTLELREDDWDRIIDTDLKGYFLCSQAVGKGMAEKRKGNIISMASTDAFKASEKIVAYSIAKAGVVMLTRVLSQELARYSIRVNAIAPPSVRAPISVVWDNPEEEKRRAAKIPIGRIAEPSDVAAVALFLASDASSFITGQTIIVDGGLLA